MYPTTTVFQDVVRAGGYVRTTTASIFFQGTFVTEVPISGGYVDVDRTATTRRSCNVTIADETFIPLFVNSPLAPYGAEIVINTGIAYDNGQTEMVTVGTFRIQEVTWSEASGSLPNVIGYDRSMVLQDARTFFPQDYSGFDAFTFFNNIQVTLSGAWGGIASTAPVPINIDGSLTSFKIPGGTILDSDYWGFVNQLAKSMGAEAYFDVHGNLIIAPIPNITQAQVTSTTPVWTVDVGPTGVLVDAARGVSRTGVYNVVAITGSSSTGASPMGWAADTDPRSPTYWGPASSLPYGPYGRSTFGDSVLRESNSLCVTPTQCTTAAQGRLAEVNGLARSLDFTSVWNPALQEGDVVQLNYLDGTTELHIIDKLHIPIGTDSAAMTASTRTLTYQLSAHT